LMTSRKLQFLFFGAQRGGEMEQVMASPPAEELGARLAGMMAGCGVMKMSLRH
jgi:hypothetical protein